MRLHACQGRLRILASNFSAFWPRVARDLAAETASGFSLLSGVNAVSIDKSLKRGNRLERARNVMKRHERVEKLLNEDRWDESVSVLGLPKTKVPKASAGRKKKKKKEEGDEAVAESND